MLNLLLLILILTGWLVFRMRKLENKLDALTREIKAIQPKTGEIISEKASEELSGCEKPADGSGQATKESSPRARLFDFTLKYEDPDRKQ